MRQRERNMVNQGDIILLDHDTKLGHEQRERVPVLVVSNESFNKYSSLAIVCPITSAKKDNPFQIKLDKRTKTTGVVLADQAKILDIITHNFEFIERIPHEILFEVTDIIGGFINFEKKSTTSS